MKTTNYWVDFAILADQRVKIKESEKKYPDLAGEQKWLRNIMLTGMIILLVGPWNCPHLVLLELCRAQWFRLQSNETSAGTTNVMVILSHFFLLFSYSFFSFCLFILYHFFWLLAMTQKDLKSNFKSVLFYFILFFYKTFPSKFSNVFPRQVGVTH